MNNSTVVVLHQENGIEQTSDQSDPIETSDLEDDNDLWAEVDLDIGTLVVHSRGVVLVDMPGGRDEDKRKDLVLAGLGIYPIAVLRARSSSGRVREYVRLRVATMSGSEREITILAGHLRQIGQTRGTGIEEIIEAGHGGGHKRLGEILEAALISGVDAGTIPVLDGSADCGWLGDRHIRPGSDGYAGTAPALSRVAGNHEVWLAAMNDMLRESPITGLVCAAAAGSHMRGIVHPDHTGILILSGPTSEGKTVALRAAASLQGSTQRGQGGPLHDALATPVGVEMLLAASNHGYLALDELHGFLAREKSPVERLMYFCNGGGRAKGGKGGAIAESLTWSCTLLGSANTSLLEMAAGHAQRDALASRVIEIDVSRRKIWPWRDSERISQYEHVLAENHGHAYPLITDYIVKNRGKLEKKYNDEAGAVSSVASSSMAARRGKNWALVAVGIEILRDAVGIEENACRAAERLLADLMLEDLGDDTEQQDPETRAAEARDMLEGWVMSALGHVEWDGYFGGGGSDQQIMAAKEITASARRAGVWARVEKDQQGEGLAGAKVYISSAGAQDAARRGLDVRHVAEIAREGGWLIMQASGKGLQLVKRGLGKCYAFQF